MKTVEEVKKIESVVLYVLQKFPEGVDYIKLFKIIYFAQKESLVNYGKILFPDTFVARIDGSVPVLFDKVIRLVELNEDIKSYPDLKSFCSSLRVCDKKVFALAKPDMDYLSCKECEILDKQSKSGLSSDFLDEAYNKAFEGGIITNIEIAKAGGANEKMIAYIREKELLSAVFS